MFVEYLSFNLLLVYVSVVFSSKMSYKSLGTTRSLLKFISTVPVSSTFESVTATGVVSVSVVVVSSQLSSLYYAHSKDVLSQSHSTLEQFSS